MDNHRLQAVKDEKPRTHERDADSFLTESLTVSVCALEIVRLTKELDDAVNQLYTHSANWAKEDNEYRHRKAKVYFECPDERVKDREAYVDLHCADHRLAAHMSDAMRQACMESVRAKRTQLSALQSLMAALKSEMDLAR